MQRQFPDSVSLSFSPFRFARVLLHVIAVLMPPLPIVRPLRCRTCLIIQTTILSSHSFSFFFFSFFFLFMCHYQRFVPARITYSRSTHHALIRSYPPGVPRVQFHGSEWKYGPAFEIQMTMGRARSYFYASMIMIHLFADRTGSSKSKEVRRTDVREKRSTETRPSFSKIRPSTNW